MTGSWPELPDEGATGGAKPLPAPPSLSGTLRASISDFYFNSWRLVPANLIWGLGLAIVYLASFTFWPAAVVLAPLLCLPVVSMHRIGGRIVRGGDVSLSDGFRLARGWIAAVIVGRGRGRRRRW